MSNSIAIGVAYTDQAIVGGSVDNSPIGATTASTGAFTTLTATSITNTGAGVFVGLITSGANLIASSSASTLAFFSSVAVSQPALSAYAAVATTAVINSSTSATCFGFTSAQATALITLANGLRATLVTLGLGAT